VIKGSYAVIKSESVEDTARFYEDYFGFERSFAADWYVSLKSGAFELAVVDPAHESLPQAYRGKTSNQSVFVNIETDEVDDIFERVSADGRVVHLALRDEPWGQRHFITEDPNGIPVDVIKVIPPSEEFVEQYA
jgi:uncharacterized glyoxalase superfamily protein PhnB